MAKTGHPNFQLHMWMPWRGVQKRWTIASSHSGLPFTATSDQLAFMISVWDNISPYFAKAWQGVSGFYCGGYSYYDGTNSAPIGEATYANLAAAVAAGFVTTAYGDAYAAEGVQASPEVCVRVQAPVGLSKTGKPVTIKHFIHGVDGTPGTSGTDQPNWSSGYLTYAENLGNGNLYGTRVLCSGSGKQGTWTVYTYYANHQMYRKRKKAGSSSSSILSAAEALAEKALQDALSAA